MTSYGYSLMTEQYGPKELVANAIAAEQAGFDFATISDHFHPWLDAQGQSPFAWNVLGAVAARTQRMGLMTMVTCPFLRYHPAVVAQSAATLAVLSDGRFTLGLGSGENLNEHVVGAGWPPVDIRHEMLAESIEIMRRLWSGGVQSFHGDHLSLEEARLYTLPDSPPPVAVAAGGPAAAALAGERGDALVAVEPSRQLVDAYRQAGGRGPAYGQVALCWAEDEASARQEAWKAWRFAVPGWKVMAELPNPANFEAATATVREFDVAEKVPCGPDPKAHLSAITAFLDAGFDQVAVVQAGPDQSGFLRFWSEELRPRLD